MAHSSASLCIVALLQTSSSPPPQQTSFRPLLLIPMSSSVLAGKEAALSINESAFLRTSLAAGLRLDGRALTDVRRVTLSFLGASGTVQAQIGDTRVVAVTTADLAAPFPDRPNEGALNMFVHFSPVNCAQDRRRSAQSARGGIEMDAMLTWVLLLCALSSARLPCVRSGSSERSRRGSESHCGAWFARVSCDRSGKFVRVGRREGVEHSM